MSAFSTHERRRIAGVIIDRPGRRRIEVTEWTCGCRREVKVPLSFTPGPSRTAFVRGPATTTITACREHQEDSGDIADGA